MLKSKIDGGVYRISFHKTDRLNSLFAIPLREKLCKILSKPGREVILSLDGISFMDNSGLEAIMAAVHKASEAGSRFRICDVSGDVYELLKLMKLKVMFEIDPVRSRKYIPSL